MGAFGTVEPLVRVALTTAVGSLVLALALVVAALGIRITTTRAAARAERVTARWRPILGAALVGDPVRAPDLSARDAPAVFALWARYTDMVRGPARSRLAALGRDAGFVPLAQRLLGSRSTTKRLLAARPLGLFADDAALPALETLLAREESVVWLSAAVALAEAVPDRAPRLVAARLTERLDWHPSQLSGLLPWLDAAALAMALSAELDRAETATQAAILRLLRTLRAPEALPGVRTLLDRTRDTDVAAAAIQVLGSCRDPQDRDRIHDHLLDLRPAVRVQAVRALAEFGDVCDRDLLLARLGDDDRWVRHRAAEALATATWSLGRDVEAMLEAVADRYGRDALAQALAETRP